MKYRSYIIPIEDFKSLEYPRHSMLIISNEIVDGDVLLKCLVVTDDASVVEFESKWGGTDV